MSGGTQLVIFFPALIVVGTVLLLIRVVRRAGRNRPFAAPERPFRHWPWVIGVGISLWAYLPMISAAVQNWSNGGWGILAFVMSTPFLIALLIVLAYYRRAYLLATPAKN